MAKKGVLTAGGEEVLFDGAYPFAAISRLEAGEAIINEVKSALVAQRKGETIKPCKSALYFSIVSNTAILRIRKGGKTKPAVRISGDAAKAGIVVDLLGHLSPAEKHEKVRLNDPCRGVEQKQAAHRLQGASSNPQ